MDIESIYKSGFDYRCNGQYADAKAEFLKLLDVAPGHADARWQLGLIMGFEGDFDGSLVALQGVVRDHPQHYKALYDLAMTEMMLGMFDEAKSHFQAVLVIYPQHEDAHKQLDYF